MLKRISLLILSVLFFCVSFSQNKFQQTDFAAVDNFARTIEYNEDLVQLTKALTASYNSDVFKVRSIFIWITENLQYDYKFYNSGKEVKGPECEDVIDCSVITAEWETKYLKKILKQKKAICDGYSRLFCRMCKLAGIESEMVNGYARTEKWQIGSSFHVNHSWNAVYLDSSWYFLDATWAAGYCEKDPETDELTKFKKNYDEYYWLTPPKKLNRNHYPEKGKWAYEENFTREKFVRNPYYAGFVLDKLDLISPATGLLEVCFGDTIHFKFAYDDYIGKLQINSNIYSNPPVYITIVSKGKTKTVTDTAAFSKQKYIAPVINGNTYEFDYIVSNESLYFLELLFDYNTVLRFRVRVKTD